MSGSALDHTVIARAAGWIADARRIVVLTGYGSIATAMDAVRRGAALPAAALSAGVIASSAGSAIKVPRPRRNVRRGKARCFICGEP